MVLQRMEVRKNFKIISVIFLAALLLRILYIFTLDNVHIGLWDDEGWEIAKNLVEGKGYSMSYHVNGLLSFRPPVFPLFLAGVFAIFGQNILVTRIFLAIANSFICLVIFFLGRRMFNREVGLLAMAISAFYPVFIYWSGYLGPETLAILFLTLSILFLLRTEENPFFYSILAGISIGLFSMCRSVGYGLIPLYIIWLTIAFKDKRRALTVSCIILILIALIVSPWIIRNYRVHRRFVLASTEGGITFYSANNPGVLTKGRGDFCVPKTSASEISGLSEIEADKYCYKRGLDFVRKYPLTYLRLVFERGVRFWRFYPHITGAEDSYKPIHIIIMLITDPAIILLGLLGLVIFYKRQKQQAIIFVLVFVYFTAISMLLKSSIRYRAPIMPCLIVLASYTIYLGYAKTRSYEQK